jgi:hypothetical protein
MQSGLEALLSCSLFGSIPIADIHVMSVCSHLFIFQASLCHHHHHHHHHHHYYYYYYYYYYIGGGGGDSVIISNYFLLFRRAVKETVKSVREKHF